MFKDYQSKPITRKAHKITDECVITKLEAEATYQIKSPTLATYKFKAYEDINVGDFIVFLNDDDIYHCNAIVFADRNIV